MQVKGASIRQVMTHMTGPDGYAFRALMLSLQFTLEFFNLLQNPWIIGGVLNRLMLQPPLAAANPVDEGTKQPHVGIQAFQYLRGPATRLESQWTPGLDDRKALR
ncbi:MAG: hypothetical protein BGP09_02705 [Rhizobium sp. 60-20]|nr:MAG: hypothetical protein BGP09_02705 [Rhizobium sp. 60-20]